MALSSVPAPGWSIMTGPARYRDPHVLQGAQEHGAESELTVAVTPSGSLPTTPAMRGDARTATGHDTARCAAGYGDTGPTEENVAVGTWVALGCTGVMLECTSRSHALT
jgi:hypothetical protein